MPSPSVSCTFIHTHILPNRQTFVEKYIYDARCSKTVMRERQSTLFLFQFHEQNFQVRPDRSRFSAQVLLRSRIQLIKKKSRWLIHRSPCTRACSGSGIQDHRIASADQDRTLATQDQHAETMMIRAIISYAMATTSTDYRSRV